jgi:hypothetical protein
MKTPKEEAIGIVNEFLQVYDGRVIIAKKASLIAVNLLLDEIFFEDETYWHEVKKEIELL